ncbi:cation:dicarboxylate symporter family transporter [Candidatus Trichorickettsia mobilis]|uniref:cation:dicarboxylate symporter family transporter n=1 Tax=Candidatus Trichorickettsia mobilis TaxID=1346319 RepID=UPI0029309B82|nr:cation:dicarboxylase symporter family transporter [Candidatus Trichorickettsia mobilis]
MLRKMPFILVLIILSIIFLNQFIPFNYQQLLYAISLSIKSLIIFLLPFIIFGLLFKAAVNLSNNATRVITIILITVCCSNFFSTFISHYIGSWIYDFNLSIITPNNIEGLTAISFLSLPQIITNSMAMFSGVILGILTARCKPAAALVIASKLEYMVAIILKLFIYLIPIFVAGFIVKLQYDGVINTIIKDYTLIFIIVALAQFSYITMTYYIFSSLKFNEFIRSIKNILPAAITGFSTMSSAASMPLTIIGAENNATDKDLARSVIPATVNIHLVGDCFAIPIFAYAVLKNYGFAEPDLIAYLTFSCYFVLAKFSVAAIPGGGIIVMLPILENYLGFNTDMMSLITALYILFDPVITCANVLGNGAFAKGIDKILVKL